MRVNLDLGAVLRGLAPAIMGGVDAYANPDYNASGMDQWGNPVANTANPYITPSFWSRWMNPDVANQVSAANEQWRMLEPMAMKANSVRNNVNAQNYGMVRPIVANAFPGATDIQAGILTGGNPTATNINAQDTATRSIAAGLPQAGVDSTTRDFANKVLSDSLEQSRLQRGLFEGLGDLRGQADVAGVRESIANSKYGTNVRIPSLTKLTPRETAQREFELGTKSLVNPYNRIADVSAAQTEATLAPTIANATKNRAYAADYESAIKLGLSQEQAKAIALLRDTERKRLAAGNLAAGVLPKELTDESVVEANIGPDGGVTTTKHPALVSPMDKVKDMTGGPQITPVPGIGGIRRLPEPRGYQPTVAGTNPPPGTVTTTNAPSITPSVANGQVSIGGLVLGKEPIPADVRQEATTALHKALQGTALQGVGVYNIRQLEEFFMAHPEIPNQKKVEILDAFNNREKVFKSK